MKQYIVFAIVALCLGTSVVGCAKSEHYPPAGIKASQYARWRGIPPRPDKSYYRIKPVKVASNPAEILQHAPGWQMNTGFDTTAVESPADYKEVDWSRWIATQADHDPILVCEVRTRSGKRVDILTDHEAIEVEWVSKWYQAVGQSGFYAIETGRQPAIVLLSAGNDEKEILLCQAVCARYGIRLYVQKVPAPERNRIEEIPAALPRTIPTLTNEKVTLILHRRN